MKNIVLKTCLTALALSVAGLANAGEPVKIFTEQLTSHAAISAAAISISADSFVDGHIASQAAATTGARSEVQNIVSGAATGIGAAAKTCDIYAGAAIAVGAGSTVGVLTAGGAVTLGALANRDVMCVSAPAVVTSDFDAANAQIKSAQSALDTIPASSLVDAYTLVGSMDTGVYEGAAITIPANTLITFDANGQDGVWIFNLSGAMTVGAGSEFEIINAGDNNAVIWNIGGALTLGAGSTFLGTAFVEGAVSGATASVSCGNLYATGAISIGSIGSIGGDDCKVSADQLADFDVESLAWPATDPMACPIWTQTELASIPDIDFTASTFSPGNALWISTWEAGTPQSGRVGLERVEYGVWRSEDESCAYKMNFSVPGGDYKIIANESCGWRDQYGVTEVATQQAIDSCSNSLEAEITRRGYVCSPDKFYCRIP
jgi:hypothetical protein